MAICRSSETAGAAAAADPRPGSSQNSARRWPGDQAQQQRAHVDAPWTRRSRKANTAVSRALELGVARRPQRAAEGRVVHAEGERRELLGGVHVPEGDRAALRGRPEVADGAQQRRRRRSRWRPSRPRSPAPRARPRGCAHPAARRWRRGSRGRPWNWWWRGSRSRVRPSPGRSAGAGAAGTRRAAPGRSVAASGSGPGVSTRITRGLGGEAVVERVQHAAALRRRRDQRLHAVAAGDAQRDQDRRAQPRGWPPRPPIPGAAGPAAGRAAPRELSTSAWTTM